MNLQKRKEVAIVLYSTTMLVIFVMACAHLVILASGAQEKVSGIIDFWMIISSMFILIAIIFDVFSTIIKRYKFVSAILSYVAFIFTIILFTICIIAGISFVDYLAVLACNIALGGAVYIGYKFKKICVENTENVKISELEARVKTIEEKFEVKKEKPIQVSKTKAVVKKAAIKKDKSISRERSAPVTKKEENK